MLEREIVKTCRHFAATIKPAPEERNKLSPGRKPWVADGK